MSDLVHWLAVLLIPFISGLVFSIFLFWTSRR
jgi:membrane protein CcdC involved in cytochrome C biogenesis